MPTTGIFQHYKSTLGCHAFILLASSLSTLCMLFVLIMTILYKLLTDFVFSPNLDTVRGKLFTIKTIRVCAISEVPGINSYEMFLYKF